MSNIEPITRATLDKLDKGGLTLGDLLRVIAPDTKLVPVKKVALAKKVALSTEATEALGRLPLRFASAVCPSEPRRLSADEVAALLDERGDLDAIEAAIKQRKEAQRTIVLNHHDRCLEETIPPEELATIPTDEDGHYYAPSFVGVEGRPIGFRKRVVNGAPTLSAADLESLVGEIDGFTQELYLACTRAERVVDEAKVLIALRTLPEVMLRVLRAAQQPGKRTIFHELGKEQ